MNILKKIQTFIIVLSLFFGLGLLTTIRVASALDQGTAQSDVCNGINTATGSSTNSTAGSTGGTASTTTGSTNSGCGSSGTSGINSLVSVVVSVLSYIVGGVAIIMIIVGGFRFIISGGDSNSTASARNTIVYALIGLAVAVLAQILVHFVLGKLINL